jgi:acetyltransferase-like isoleucine patch superfamily enzyme
VARSFRRRAAGLAHDLAPVGRTAQRVLPGQRPPAPGAFAHFGEGSWVVPPVRVRAPGRIEIGAQVIVLEYSTLWVDGEDAGPALLRIGDGVRLARFNHIVCSVGVTIGNDVSSSDSASVADTWAPVDAGADPEVAFRAPVVVGDGAYLGCNSVVLPGVTIGTGAYVGEGAVVAEDVPDHTVVYGNPARVVRRHEPAAGAWRDVAP